MKIRKKNIFDKPIAVDSKQETNEELIKARDFTVERIFTNEAFKQPGKWYDQEKDEWVLLLQGEALLEFKDEGIVRLHKGDYINISARKVHRVSQTSEDIKCIWLTIFGNFK